MDERAAERPETLPSELAWRLREVESAVSPEEIAEIWVFPPLSDVEGSSEFLLFTRFLGDERRRVYTARIPADAMAERGRSSGNGGTSNGASAPTSGRDGTDVDEARAERNGARGGGSNGRAGQEIRDHGTVPAERMPRFVENFLRRLDGEAGEPIHVVVDGCRRRWVALLPFAGNGHGGVEANARNGDHASPRR